MGESFSDDMLLELLFALEMFPESLSAETDNSQAVNEDSIAVAMNRAAFGQIIFFDMIFPSSY